MHNYALLVGGIWLILQIAALWKLRGWWQKAAWLSAAVMGLAIIIAVVGVLAGSDLAPIWVVLAMPVCLLWTVMLWIIRGVNWIIVR